MIGRDVPIPTRMQGLKRDKRGYPIPVIVTISNDGMPHFTVNNIVKVNWCVQNDCCAICGGKLTRGRWWVGGPLSAFVKDGSYIDTPLHHECMRYAVQVCPYLAAPNYSGRISGKSVKPEHGIVLADDTTMIPDRPKLFVAVMGIKTLVTQWTPAAVYTRPPRPYHSIEYWKDGLQLPKDLGSAMAGVVVKEWEASRAVPAKG